MIARVNALERAHHLVGVQPHSLEVFVGGHVRVSLGCSGWYGRPPGCDRVAGTTMRQYFPFTDYDFYAYLTAGAGLLFAIDLTFNDADITRLPEWTVVRVGLVTALAYVVGQLTA